MAANSRHNFEFSSWYNTQLDPQLLETAECLFITIEHFS